jgi:hypothetical protein
MRRIVVLLTVVAMMVGMLAMSVAPRSLRGMLRVVSVGRATNEWCPETN